MDWPAAEVYLRAGRRVRREIWADRWLLFYREFFHLQKIDRLTRQVSYQRICVGGLGALDGDFLAADFLAEDYTLDPPPEPARPLGTVTCTDAFGPTPFSFGAFDPGSYRVVFERGAMYYVAGNKNQLRCNSFSTSANGFKVVSGGIEYNCPGFNQTGDNSGRFDAADPRSEAELLAVIDQREAGKEVSFPHPGGEIYIYLLDDYVNNAISAEMPTFSLYAG